MRCSYRECAIGTLRSTRRLIRSPGTVRLDLAWQRATFKDWRLRGKLLRTGNYLYPISEARHFYLY